VASRSGLSVKANLETGAGWIDGDYRGIVKVELKNFGSKPYQVIRGDRIAQLMVLPLVEVEVNVVDDVKGTSRGGGGFGSTGS
jgi:dUTP pyrophosphatase